MRRLRTQTIEEQIGELDALVDDLVRKPRKEITNIVCRVPGGCLLEPVVSGLKVFVGFFTTDASLDNLVLQLPDVKPCQLVIEAVTDNITNQVSFEVRKGINKIDGPIKLKKNTKISVIINTDHPIDSAVFGYTLSPEVKNETV